MSRYIEEVAALAHNLTKEPGIPDFEGCIQNYREKQLTHAEAVERSGVPADSPSEFEIKVGELLADPVGTQAALSKAKVDAANAVAAAMAENAKAVAASASAEVKEAKAAAKEEVKDKK